MLLLRVYLMAFSVVSIHNFFIRPAPTRSTATGDRIASAAGNAYDSGTGKTAPAADLMVSIGWGLDGVDSR